MLREGEDIVAVSGVVCGWVAGMWSELERIGTRLGDGAVRVLGAITSAVRVLNVVVDGAVRVLNGVSGGRARQGRTED